MAEDWNPLIRVSGSLVSLAGFRRSTMTSLSLPLKSKVNAFPGGELRERDLHKGE